MKKKNNKSTKIAIISTSVTAILVGISVFSLHSLTEGKNDGNLTLASTVCEESAAAPRLISRIDEASDVQFEAAEPVFSFEASDTVFESYNDPGDQIEEAVPVAAAVSIDAGKLVVVDNTISFDVVESITEEFDEEIVEQRPAAMMSLIQPEVSQETTADVDIDIPVTEDSWISDSVVDEWFDNPESDEDSWYDESEEDSWNVSESDDTEFDDSSADSWYEDSEASDDFWNEDSEIEDDSQYDDTENSEEEDDFWLNDSVVDSWGGDSSEDDSWTDESEEDDDSWYDDSEYTWIYDIESETWLYVRVEDTWADDSEEEDDSWYDDAEDEDDSWYDDSEEDDDSWYDDSEEEDSWYDDSEDEDDSWYDEPSNYSLGQQIVNYAFQWVGVTPYVDAYDRWTEYGYYNSLIDGTDCSGFTHLIYGEFGIYVPTGSDVYQYGVGTQISYEQLVPGDIVVYRYGGHVAIYAGDDMIIHCSNPSRGTCYDSMWYQSPTAYVRVVY